MEPLIIHSFTVYRAEHGGWAFEWPATKILRDSSGMKDSFRELHPDPLADPGM